MVLDLDIWRSAKLLVDRHGRVFDERNGDEITSEEIIEWVKSQDEKPCYGDAIDHAYERRFDR